MKITVFFCLLLLATSCSPEPIKEKKEKEVTENLIEYKHGIYTEYYPGKQKVKIRGAQDTKGIRDGKWVLLSPLGKEMSITFFDKGLREGHTIVKHPNGTINYVGEYLHNEQIGIWKFYDETGKLIKEEDYSKTPVQITNF
jgi:antitoxin component YwqK of YwqJK toxin-antitoxin module